MRAAVDALWEAFGGQGSGRGYSWIGFYTKASDRDEMDLSVCRDTPACSPIALHGMCGRSWQTGRAVIVKDISRHEPDHIVCDPANQSELVVPLFEADERCWGVLDADSYDVDSFDAHDAAELGALMEQLELSVAQYSPDPIVL